MYESLQKLSIVYTENFLYQYTNWRIKNTRNGSLPLLCTKHKMIWCVLRQHCQTQQNVTCDNPQNQLGLYLLLILCLLFCDFCLFAIQINLYFQAIIQITSNIVSLENHDGWGSVLHVSKNVFSTQIRISLCNLNRWTLLEMIVWATSEWVLLSHMFL